MIKLYNEVCRLKTFEDRYNYLKLNNVVGQSTFGFSRYLNQALYKSREWKSIRRDVIVRDEGCDLGIKDRKIYGRILIHHINPICIEDIENHADCLFNINNLICTSEDTHNAIHYGDLSLLPQLPKERSKGDMCPWIVY